MAPAKTFHRFPDLPPEIQLMIWKVPLEAGYVLEHEEQSEGDITLTPLTWDYSALRETCVDAARTVQKSCKLVTLPDPMYCIGPEGEPRIKHLELNVFVYAQSTGKPRRGDDMPLPNEMAEGIESRELTEDGEKGLVDIKTASNRKFVALTEKEFEVVRASVEGHMEVLESLLIYQGGYPDGVYSFRATFCTISYMADLRLRMTPDV